MASLAHRLQHLIDVKGLSQADLSRATGIPAPTINRYFKEERGVTNKHLITICKYFGVDEHWLLTGEGSMNRLEKSKDLAPDEYNKGKTTNADNLDGQALKTILQGTGMLTIGDKINWFRKHCNTDDEFDLMLWQEEFEGKLMTRIKEIAARSATKKKSG